jgi:hypothetical protein
MEAREKLMEEQERAENAEASVKPFFRFIKRQLARFEKIPGRFQKRDELD